MCVKPSHQRKGIGSKLVQLGFDRAHAEGIPLTICAEAPAYEFFNKLGFEDMTHYDIDLRKYAPANSGFGIFRLTGMVWRP
jgi:predicted N-acetyltransferase YhbS